jgi:hypothetical protein
VALVVQIKVVVEVQVVIEVQYLVNLLVAAHRLKHRRYVLLE